MKIEMIVRIFINVKMPKESIEFRIHIYGQASKFLSQFMMR